MKSKEIRELSDVEAQAKVRDLRQELFNLRLQQQGARLERPSRLHDVRRDVARIETILREHQLKAVASKSEK